MVDLHGLSASDYSGMSPQQMLGVGSFERGKFSDALQMAGMVTEANRAKQAFEYQKQKDNVALKLSIAEKKMSALFEKKKADLDARRADLYERQIEVMESQDERATKVLKQEQEDLERKRKRLEGLQGIEVKTNASDKPMSLLSMITLKEAGVPIDFAKDAEIDKYFIDENGEIKIVMSDTSVVTVEELMGAEALQTRTEQTNISTEEKAYRGKIGKTKAELKSPDYLINTRKTLTEEDTNYDMLSMSSREEDQAKADKILRDRIMRDIRNTYTETLNKNKGSKVVYARPRGSDEYGFYIDFGNGKVQPIMGDYR